MLGITTDEGHQMFASYAQMPVSANNVTLNDWTMTPESCCSIKHNSRPQE